MTTTPDRAATAAFSSAFGDRPTLLTRAPSRVELLGNHTDYNGGLVLAAAIDRFTAVAARPHSGREARVVTLDLDQRDQFDLDAIEPGEAGSWVRYVRGVAWALGERFGPLVTGFDLAMAGNVPIGAGLSSSASVQAAVALALLAANVVGQGATDALDDPSRMALAHTLRRSENEFVGVGSGLLDQFSVLFGRTGHALRLDCRSLDYERLPLGDPAPAIVVCDSKTSRRLADGKYNERRAECDRVVDYFRSLRPDRGISQLRDIEPGELRDEWDRLDPVGRLRARHVLTENDRVSRGAEALKAGDVAGFGRLMTESHASSRDDFENSSPELDSLIEIAREAPGFLGGKLSGAGWAGCTVNLVSREHAPAFSEALRSGYQKRTGLEPTIHVCLAADGAAARELGEG